jgi:hypothetical protein
MSRWIRFIIALLIGAALGLLYGWVINPVKYVDTTPNTLKIDYKSDYVLMVAESYHANNDLPLAARRLALLGNEPPSEIVHQAIVSSEPYYTDADLTLMRALYQAVQSWNPALETPLP